MAARHFTDELVTALRVHGPAVANIECSERSGDPDLIYLSGEDYLAVDYEDFERIGVIGVSLNTSMPVGGDILNAFWSYPATSALKIAIEISEWKKG